MSKKLARQQSDYGGGQRRRRKVRPFVRRAADRTMLRTVFLLVAFLTALAILAHL